MPGGESAEKLSLKSLDKRLQDLEAEVAFATVPDSEPEVTAEQFYDLLIGIIESLVRTRSSGAYRTATALRDKYLDPEVDITKYGEEFVATGQLYSASKGEE